ncbi:MAG TPA: arginine--tRNA ligase [Dehalococcoidia bacterium]|nr:arginine--tRNA ligase [Dehalococcoidia bacterium]
MIKHEIAALVREAIASAQRSGSLAEVPMPDVVIERPQRPEHGDYATSVPLRLARAARLAPLAIAEAVVQAMPPHPAIESVEVAPPGFVNVRLAHEWLTLQVENILAAGDTYGNSEPAIRRRVQIEFVSANPTGPLHVGNGRWATIGSTLANVLEAGGHYVEQEYYINDAGSQVDTFASTLLARYRQLFGKDQPIPENGYPGEYVLEVAAQLRDTYGDRFLDAPIEDPPDEVRRFAVERMVARIRDDLAAMGVSYHVWFNERSLYEGEPSAYQRAMARLREQGFVAEREGAVWFTSSRLGEEKDNVLIRSDGQPTYFASDVAYHYDKFITRRFDDVIDIWGADHQGHVSRLKAAVGALGIDPARLHIILGQLVTLKRGPEVVRISKRSGDIITLREVIDEVGADACRFFFLSRSADAQMDFDLELAKKQSQDNPVYYVQYAHARIAGVIAHALERGVDARAGDVTLLTHPAELELIRKMLRLPELLETIAGNLEPHHLPHYAQELATAFHAFYTECRVVSDDAALSAARLKLVQAARIALARTLHLMGVSAPERM